jgi:hypothetical protein
VCLTQCQTHDCVKDGNCPMNVHPSATAAASNCIMCLSCVRACTHNAVRVEVRAPWRGIVDGKKWELSRACLAVVLVATVLSLKLAEWITIGGTGATGATADAYPDLTAPAIVVFVALTIGYVGLVVLASGGLGRAQIASGFAHAGRVYVPLAVAGFFNIHFREFVEHGSAALPMVVDTLGLAAYIPTSTVTPDLGTLKALIPLVTLASVIAALLMLANVSEKYSFSRASLRAHQLILTATAILFIHLL